MVAIFCLVVERIELSITHNNDCFYIRVIEGPTLCLFLRRVSSEIVREYPDPASEQQENGFVYV
jgi:hypothetical protein